MNIISESSGTDVKICSDEQMESKNSLVSESGMFPFDRYASIAALSVIDEKFFALLDY